ncbi:hypothetical protein F4802DRAFT_2805 [Xylaria palmicola]|nr:hypothetical protein F4802DRAFT_2805 [Xylaria palmicola]
MAPRQNIDLATPICRVGGCDDPVTKARLCDAHLADYWKRKTARAEQRTRYKELGLCYLCGKAAAPRQVPTAAGLKCTACLNQYEQARQRYNEHRERCKREALCDLCGAPSTGFYCPECKDRKKQLGESRKEMGDCSMCGRPAPPGFVRCSGCRAKCKAQRRALMTRRLKNGGLVCESPANLSGQVTGSEGGKCSEGVGIGDSPNKSPQRVSTSNQLNGSSQRGVNDLPKETNSGRMSIASLLN